MNEKDKCYPLTEHIELYAALSGRDTGDKQIQQNKMLLLLNSLIFPVILSLSPIHTHTPWASHRPQLEGWPLMRPEPHSLATELRFHGSKGTPMRTPDPFFLSSSPGSRGAGSRTEA